jgi:hypothetical protein
VFSPDIARVLSDDRLWRPAPDPPRRSRARAHRLRAVLHAVAPRLRATGAVLLTAAHLRRRPV